MRPRGTATLARVSPYRSELRITRIGATTSSATFVVEDAQLGDLASNGRNLSGTVTAWTPRRTTGPWHPAGTLPRQERACQCCVGIAGYPRHATRPERKTQPPPRPQQNQQEARGGRRLLVRRRTSPSRPLDDGAHQRAPGAEPGAKPVDPPRWPASREIGTQAGLRGHRLPWTGTISSKAASISNTVVTGTARAMSASAIGPSSAWRAEEVMTPTWRPAQLDAERASRRAGRPAAGR